MELNEIKNRYLDNKSFVPIEGYETLFGIQIFKSGRKHIKEEHVYYCYTPNDFDYSVYKNFVGEVRDYEKSKGYEFRKTYNLLRYEIFGDLYLYQLFSCGSKDIKYNFTKFE
jgi:hypothetical protein